MTAITWDSSSVLWDGAVANWGSAFVDGDPELLVEIGLLNGGVPIEQHAVITYTDVTDYFIGGQVKYGRAHLTERFRAGTFTARFDNADRRFDPEYSDSPYSRTHLDVSGTPSYAEHADSAALSPTGDLTLTTMVSTDDWSPASTAVLLSKWDSGQRSYELRLTTAGAVQLAWSTNGSDEVTATSTANLASTAADGKLWIWATLDANNGAGGYDVKFYTADGVYDDELVAFGAWTQLGSTVTGGSTTSVFNGTSDFRVGRNSGGGGSSYNAKFRYVAVHSGVYPSVVLANSFTQRFDIGYAEGTDDVPGWTIEGTGIVWEESRLRTRIPIRVTATQSGSDYVLFTGYINNLAQTYEGPNQSWMTTTAKDPLDLLATYDLPNSFYEATVLADSPTAYWPMNERAGLRANDATGNDRHLIYRRRIQTADPLVTGDAHSAKTFDRVINDGAYTASTSYRINVDSNDWLVELWFELPAEPPPSGTSSPHQVLFVQGGTVGTDDTIAITYVHGLFVATPGQMVFHFGSTTYDINLTTDATFMDGEVHHVVWGRRGGSIVCMIDNTAVSTSVVYGYGDDTAQVISVGGAADNDASPIVTFRGVLGHVAMYANGLSASRVTEHYQTGTTAGAGDLSDERIERILDEAGIPDTSTYRDLDVGTQTFGATSFSSKDSALNYVQDCEISETGMFYADTSGKFIFKNRTNTWAAPTVTHTFVDKLDGGSDLPYSMDDFTYEMDRDAIINRVRLIDDESGAVTTYEDSDSVRENGVQGLTLERGMAEDDAAMRSLGAELVSRYGQPRMRLGTLIVNPRSQPYGDGSWTNGELWNAILGLYVHEAITVKRTPQGVGSEISHDYWVEGWTHTFAAKRWRTEIVVTEV